ncbi:MAG: sodium:proton antiporter [Lachnospiraceae bacterium]|nr:sodium:proton antiporter [Lachnospiraceae bacterium]
MMNFLTYAVILLGLIVVIGFINEKSSKLTYEIALMLFSVVIGGLLTVVYALVKNQEVRSVIDTIRVFNLEDFLMKGVLCFMLFAGSFRMRLSDFKRLARPIGVLAFLATFLGAVFYGGLFFLAARLFNLPFSLPMCLMFGSIVAPTDPIAATSILNKFGLPKDISFVLEGESLLNDGVGVALFVCFSNMVKAEQSAGSNFFVVMARELLGAILIGTAVTALCYLLFKFTKDCRRRIFISLFMVALAYGLCEIFDCSGAIASVVCGALFATFRGKEEYLHGKMDLEDFDSFWETIDNLLNSILYVILGLSFVKILQMHHVIIMSLVAILCNTLGRGGSVFASTFLIGKLPDNYNRGNFTTLFTWGGLKGGLCIALAMSTAPMVSATVYHIILGCTYAIVFFTTIIQGLSVKKVYDGITKRMEAKKA